MTVSLRFHRRYHFPGVLRSVLRSLSKNNKKGRGTLAPPCLEQSFSTGRSLFIYHPTRRFLCGPSVLSNQEPSRIEMDGEHRRKTPMPPPTKESRPIQRHSKPSFTRREAASCHTWDLPFLFLLEEDMRRDLCLIRPTIDPDWKERSQLCMACGL
jgi:hypothetical protein